ncbi:hypothetical protein VNO77_22392 [Canavalia gladiata]|uniref:Uncharacterized protein n=1 Tax=Canavalia gladiata TaxID=3824 RepID=A0AAN9L2Y1_CANGL
MNGWMMNVLVCEWEGDHHQKPECAPRATSTKTNVQSLIKKETVLCTRFSLTVAGRLELLLLLAKDLKDGQGNMRVNE